MIATSKGGPGRFLIVALPEIVWVTDPTYAMQFRMGDGHENKWGTEINTLHPDDLCS